MKHLSRCQKQTTFIVIGTLRIMQAFFVCCSHGWNLILHAGYFFMLMLSSADVFQSYFFLQTILAGTLSKCQVA